MFEVYSFILFKHQLVRFIWRTVCPPPTPVSIPLVQTVWISRAISGGYEEVIQTETHRIGAFGARKLIRLSSLKTPVRFSLISLIRVILQGILEIPGVSR